MAKSTLKPWLFAGSGGLLFAGLLGLGILPRLERQSTLQAAAEGVKTRAAVVTVIRPIRAESTTQTQLPGNIQALQEGTVYARADGYIKQRFVDIGDHVQKGQVLALLDTPEVDQQASELRSTLAQSRSDLQQFKANQELAQTTAQRWQNLRTEGAVSQQDVDERVTALQTRQAAVESQQATIRARQADVSRLVALQSFKQVRAPFAGIITARTVDSGALVTAGTSQSGLFKIAFTDRLRIFVNVPQTVAPAIHAGQTAHVLVQEYSGRTFKGVITRTAGALDPATRTLLTEIQLDNRDHALLPGMYAQVALVAKRSAQPFTIPDSTLIIRAKGPQVALVDSNHVVHYHNVVLGRDDGATIEVLSGLSGNEQIVVNPGDEIIDGAQVRIASPEKS
ncbi:MAG: efflux RND transporter periplasmic adaptor subunit [Anaerolineae bacterium]|nr:efflux RND transporter periplasmic adaptor subunit [Gloeobacterales cyanobacterium ES-bin-313]